MTSSLANVNNLGLTSFRRVLWQFPYFCDCLQYSYEFNYIKSRRQAVYFNIQKNLCISPLSLAGTRLLSSPATSSLKPSIARQPFQLDPPVPRLLPPESGIHANKPRPVLVAPPPDFALSVVPSQLCKIDLQLGQCSDHLQLSGSRRGEDWPSSGAT